MRQTTYWIDTNISKIGFTPSLGATLPLVLFKETFSRLKPSHEQHQGKIGALPIGALEIEARRGISQIGVGTIQHDLTKRLNK